MADPSKPTADEPAAGPAAPAAPRSDTDTLTSLLADGLARLHAHAPGAEGAPAAGLVSALVEHARVSLGLYQKLGAALVARVAEAERAARASGAAVKTTEESSESAAPERAPEGESSP
jgi:hypothetical protein